MIIEEKNLRKTKERLKEGNRVQVALQAVLLQAHLSQAVPAKVQARNINKNQAKLRKLESHPTVKPKIKSKLNKIQLRDAGNTVHQMKKGCKRIIKGRGAGRMTIKDRTKLAGREFNCLVHLRDPPHLENNKTLKSRKVRDKIPGFTQKSKKLLKVLQRKRKIKIRRKKT